MEIGSQRDRCSFTRRPRVCCWFTNAKIASLEVHAELCRSGFSLTNPNQSRNRLRLSFGLGSLSICLVHESPSLTIGLSACWTFWISSVDVFCWYPGALAVSLSSESLDELFFLRSNVTSLIGISIWPDGNKSSKVVYSDPSASAWGSFIEFEGKVFHQNWSDFKRSQSSIYRVYR